MLRIALLSHLASPEAPTGAERSLALLAAGLHRRGHRVSVATPGPWALSRELRDGGVHVEQVRSRCCWLSYYEPRSLPVATMKWLSGIRPDGSETRLRRWLEATAPDVAHVNCLPHVAGAAAAARAGIPVSWHVREILPPGWRRRWFARRIRRTDATVVAVSAAVAEWLGQEDLAGCVRVVHNGVASAPAAQDRAEARRELGLPIDGVAVGLFGQLVPHKGAFSFLRAAERASKVAPELRFVIAGAGPTSFRAEVERAIARSGVRDRLHLLPARSDVEPLYAASDVVCLATTTPDPLPRAVLEAMVRGIPVVAFDSGGTAEMVRDGETGRIVPPGDVAALADGFVELARDEGGRIRMGRAAATRARDEFSLDRHVDAMESLFRELAR